MQLSRISFKSIPKIVANLDAKLYQEQGQILSFKIEQLVLKYPRYTTWSKF